MVEADNAFIDAALPNGPSVAPRLGCSFDYELAGYPSVSASEGLIGCPVQLISTLQTLLKSYRTSASIYAEEGLVGLPEKMMLSSRKLYHPQRQTLMQLDSQGDATMTEYKGSAFLPVLKDGDSCANSYEGGPPIRINGVQCA